MHDKELMLCRLMAGVIIAGVVGVGVAFGFGFESDRAVRAGAYVPLFLIYVVTYAIGIFFQAAVVAGAMERMRGGDPTVCSALAAAAGGTGRF